MELALPDYPFRRTSHDRLADLRTDDDFVKRSWADPTSRVLLVRDSDLAVGRSSDELVAVPPAEAPPGEPVLLGRSSGVVYFAISPPVRDGGGQEPVLAETDTASTELTSHVGNELKRFESLRRLAPTLDEDAASLAVHAVAVVGWHRRHQRCAQCGAATQSAAAGAYRRCATCGADHYPRTDPAVIMLVTDEKDRCLLGHNAARPAGWFSTLAGFVEPGETPEQAVVREVQEEVGVEIGDVRYAGSQPWPFPSSLMLGYFAAAKTTTLTVDGSEITEATWFTRGQLASALQSGKLGLPTTVSIAGALITAWYGAPLPPNRLSA